MPQKSQLSIIEELQYNADVVILNNPLSSPKLVRRFTKGKEVQLNEVYTSKLFYDIVSRITPEHLAQFEEGKTTVTISLNIKEFLSSVNAGNSRSLYTHVIDCMDVLQTTQVKWSDTEKESGSAIITHYEHHKGTGKIDVVLYKELVKKVIEVTHNEHFSFFKKHLYQLQNAQAIKLFPYFVSWRNRGMVEVDLESFKKKFGYNTEGYSRFKNFYKYVLEPAIKEINEKTDLTITYKLLGTNLLGVRPRVTGLQFFIHESKQQKKLLEGQPQLSFGEMIPSVVVEEALVKTNLNTHVLDSYYEQIADFWTVDKPVFLKNAIDKSEMDIQKAMDYTKEQVRAGKANKPAAVFIDALKHGYKTMATIKKELNEQKIKADKEKTDAFNSVEVSQKEEKQQKQKNLFAQQRAIFDKLIATDAAFHKDLAELIKENNMMKNNYDFEKSILDNMQKPMIAGIVMGMAVKLRQKDFE